ncbi:hypothetical protein BGZ82_011069 [Podila clonocystis]|nr:hypothetical protein BGZ82_011069 [Podila clonocystis]
MADIEVHINRWEKLEDLDPDTPLPHESVQAIQLPKPFKITAKHVSNMAHTTKTTKKRNRQKTDNAEVFNATPISARPMHL